MDYFELIEQRESCRNFDENRPVEREKLLRCLEAARIAPSACNSQPWHFHAVTEPERLHALCRAVQALGGNGFACGSPALIAVTEEPAMVSPRVAERMGSQCFAANDIGIAAAQFCLAATAQGLSTCILGWFDAEVAGAALGLDPARPVRLVIAMGYASDGAHRQKKRKELAQMSTLYE